MDNVIREVEGQGKEIYPGVLNPVDSFSTDGVIQGPC